jgi:Methyltransferase domain
MISPERLRQGVAKRARRYSATVQSGAANLPSFVRGLRWARDLPSPAAPPEPTERAPGTLEKYFDAHVEGPGLWKWRHYFDVYERHLAKFIGRDVHVVEVGIYSGGSLPMWRDYFGEKCRIYGVDIEPACRAYAGKQVDVFIGDQGDPAFWSTFREAVPTVDILIDDGGHVPYQQIATLEAMLPHMRPGGVYLCEDIGDAANPFHAYLDGLCRPLHQSYRMPNAVQQQVASLHRYPFLAVIEKPSLPIVPFESSRHGTQWEPFLDPFL